MDLTSSPVSALLVIGILLVIGWHTAFLIKRRRWLALDPLNAFWGGVLAVYIAQPLQFAEVFARWHGPGVLEWTLCWSLMAFVCVVLGYEFGWGRALGRKLPAMPARLDGGRVVVASGVLIGAGLTGYAYLVATAGGLWDWLAVPRGGTNWAVVNSYIATSVNLLPVGVVLLLFLVNFHRGARRLAALVWGLAGLLLLWFVYMGSRSPLIGCVLSMLAAYYLPRRRNPPAWLMAAGFVGLLAVASFMAQYREYFTDLSFHLDQIDMDEASRRILPKFLGGDVRRQKQELAGGNDFNCVMTVVELVPNEVDYNYGYCLAEFLTRPVPRSMWPDKLYPHYEAFTPIYERGRLSDWEVPNTSQRILAGPAFTFVGHWYAVGGPLVLTGAGFFTGALLRGIRTVIDRAPGSQGDMVLYFILLPVGFFEAAATPLFWVFNLPFWLVGVGVLFFCRRASAPASAVRRAARRPAAYAR